MDYILCSESFKHFYDIFQEEVLSAEDCIEKFRQGILFVVDELHLGKVDIRIEAPSSVYDSQGMCADYSVYRFEEGYGNTMLQFPYETTEHGHIRIRFFARKEYTWDEREQEMLKLLARNMFFICGRARLIDLMRKAVVTDNVTGMPNLSAFLEFAGQITNKGSLQQYHGVCVNIKNFKFLNRTMSAKRSDEILRDYGRMIGRFLEEDEIIARVGGDSFIGLIRDEHIDNFMKHIADIRVYTGMESKYVQIKSRVGFYDIQMGDNIKDVMSYVDVALNAARAQGDPCVCFEHSMIEQMLQNKEISAFFSTALSNKEFEVYYQPKVNILNNTLCGCEALVRWRRKGKMIPPMEFIPVLEAEGSICALDFYVFERVCETMKDWMEQGIQPVTVSVNFSRNHLRNPYLAKSIFEIIERYGVNPEYIEIELTEMSGYDNYEKLAAFIGEMRSGGVHTSIDDFGTGYSSLNLLTDLNVDVVKLDRSFAKRIDNEEVKTKILIQNIVNMVHELGYKVIAEGVETVKQAEFLRGIGCSTVQGYLYDKPLPLNEFEQRLKGEFKYSI